MHLDFGAHVLGAAGSKGEKGRNFGPTYIVYTCTKSQIDGFFFLALFLRAPVSFKCILREAVIYVLADFAC